MGLCTAQGTGGLGNVCMKQVDGEQLARRLGDRLCRTCAAASRRMRAMDKITWFRAGGLAEAAVPAARRRGSRRLPEAAARGRTAHRRRRRLEPSGARRRHSGRRRPAFGQGLRRGRVIAADNRIRAGAARPDKRVAAMAHGGRHRRLPFLPRHSRHHRRRAPHECRRQWRRDARARRRGAGARPQGQRPCADQRRYGLRLSSLGGADRT